MKTRHKKNLKDTPSIIGTGLLALDIVFNTEGVREPRFYAGGTCGNVLSILSYMGWQAYPIARLNGDLASKHILEDLRRWGVHLEFTSCKPLCDTPVIIQKIKQSKSGQGQHRFHFRCPKCGACYPTYKPVYTSTIKQIVPKIKSPKVFFFDRVSRGALVLAEVCAEQGALVVFEPSAVGDRRLFKEALNVAHILKYSNDRIQGAPGTYTKKTNLVLEIETQGFEGLRFRNMLKRGSKKEWQHLAAYEVTKIKDAAGAGDWCTASIINIVGRDGLAGLREVTDAELIEALRYGQAAAAWNCGFEGARGGMQSGSLTAFKVGVKRIMNGSVPRLGTTDSNTNGLKEIFEQLCPACGQDGFCKR